ncbi:MAG: DUF1634 domain-containing protein [Chloroflexia bacterium]|jgi:uncharacterized membrane protein|nr:DUF1634 domain-containing protein [Chloroflexia bacterium]
MSSRQQQVWDRVHERQRRTLYTWIVRILTGGFWSSVTLIVAGVLVALVGGRPLGDEVAPLVDVVPSALDLNPQGIVDLGILLLLFTPSMYVVVSLVIFLRQRDRMFVVVCCALLAIVMVSVGLGLR